MLELAILGLLKEHDLHGYELKKRVTESTGAFPSLSYGSLYPALARLEAAGAVKAVDAHERPEAPVPVTGSLGGELATLRNRRSAAKPSARGRKVYGITDAGHALFDELLAASTTSADDDRSFGLRLAFARFLPPDQRLGLLERRRAHLVDRLARARASLRASRERVDAYSRSLLEHGNEATEHDITWLDGLIEAERRRAFSGPAGVASSGHVLIRITFLPYPKGPPPMSTEPRRTVRVAIAGVGNCASSLVQGVEYYREADPAEKVPGLMHVVLGGYHVGDVEFVAAFDVDADKVGVDLGKAIGAGQNNTIRFAEVPALGVTVQRGPTFDGFGEFYRQTCEESPAEPVDVTQVLRDSRVDVLVSYLPVGSEVAQKFYAQACIDAGVAFVNAIPVFIASNPEWAQKFTDAGVPIVGDDIKSQVGATIVHRTLARLFEDRGTTIDHTYQLNFGGNMDFMNMLERSRLKSKKISKTQSVTSQIDAGISDSDVHIGPSDHVPWLEDRKWAFIRLEGRNFGDVPLTVELKLEVHDSPNSAGVIIDAVRCAKLALDRGIGGPLLGASAYFMKSPPVQYRDNDAHQMVEDFAAGA